MPAIRWRPVAPKLPLARMLIREGAKVHVFACDKINYIEAQDDYVLFHAEGKSYRLNQPLSELESQMEASSFLRIHRSYLLNIASLSRIEASGKDSHAAILKDGTRLPISKSGYQKVRASMR
ncbi:DNA-binding LytR/AlgR family response regulator [Oxalobacteraceae bacterium GrIS 1.11]